MNTLAAHTGTLQRKSVTDRDAWTVPVLEPSPDGLAERFAAGFGQHAILAFLIVLIGGLAVLVGLSYALGLLIVHVLVPISPVGHANNHFEAWLAAHRTPDRTEASLIGSIMAGGVVLPIVVGVLGLVSAASRHWRIAAFFVFSLLLESGAYRATTLVLHEHRPRVPRLENLPVNASYPSGHTAASIAVYGGIVLLLTSKIKNAVFRAFAWTIAVAIPVFVALSRMYRGMHHPLDVAGGALLGIAALTVIVFACRSAGAAAEARSAR